MEELLIANSPTLPPSTGTGSGKEAGSYMSSPLLCASASGTPTSLTSVTSGMLHVGHAAASAEQSQSPQEYIKRPMNSFIIYSRLQRRKIAADWPYLRHADISKELGRRWGLMGEAQKRPYVDESKRLRVQQLQKYPNHKFKPRKKAAKKGKPNNGSSSSQTISTCKESIPKKCTIGIQCSMHEIAAELKSANTPIKAVTVVEKTAEISIQVGNGLANLRNAKRRVSSSSSCSTETGSSTFKRSTIQHVQVGTKRAQNQLTEQAIKRSKPMDLSTIDIPMLPGLSPVSVQNSNNCIDCTTTPYLPLSPPKSLDNFDLATSPFDLARDIDGLLPYLDNMDELADHLVKSTTLPLLAAELEPNSNCTVPVSTPIILDTAICGSKIGMLKSGLDKAYTPTSSDGPLQDDDFDFSGLPPKIFESFIMKKP